jgi:hypothetical protein
MVDSDDDDSEADAPLPDGDEPLIMPASPAANPAQEEQAPTVSATAKSIKALLGEDSDSDSECPAREQPASSEQASRPARIPTSLLGEDSSDEGDSLAQLKSKASPKRAPGSISQLGSLFLDADSEEPLGKGSPSAVARGLGGSAAGARGSDSGASGRTSGDGQQSGGVGASHRADNSWDEAAEDNVDQELSGSDDIDLPGF